MQSIYRAVKIEDVIVFFCFFLFFFVFLFFFLFCFFFFFLFVCLFVFFFSLKTLIVDAC